MTLHDDLTDRVRASPTPLTLETDAKLRLHIARALAVHRQH